MNSRRYLADLASQSCPQTRALSQIRKHRKLQVGGEVSSIRLVGLETLNANESKPKFEFSVRPFSEVSESKSPETPLELSGRNEPCQGEQRASGVELPYVADRTSL